MEEPALLDSQFESLFAENECLFDHLKDPSQRSEAEDVADLAFEKIVDHLEKSRQAGSQFRERLEALETREREEFGDFSSEEADLRRSCQEAQNGLDEAQTDLDTLKEKRRRIENELCAVGAKVEGLLLEREEDEERRVNCRDTRRHYESLLKNVTGVQFSDHCPDGRVQGHLAHGGNARVFDFDMTKNSKFFVANNLWETVYLMNK
jgi:hypothetical protein